MRLVLANPIHFSLRDINLSLGLLPSRRHVWRDRVGVGVRQVLNQSVRVIFQQSFSVLLRHTDELQ